MSWELSISLWKNWELNYKKHLLDYCVMKPHSSGFDAEHYIEQQVTEENKHSTEYRNTRLSFVCELEKQIDDRFINIMPFHFQDTDDWTNIFKHEISELYDLINDEEVYKNLFINQKSRENISFHYGIWDLDESLARWEQETKNCHTYKGWRYLLIEFPFEILENKHNELLAKFHIYKDMSYERENLIFFFEEFNTDILIKICNMYNKLQPINTEVWKKLKTLEENLLKEEKIDEQIQHIVDSTF